MVSSAFFPIFNARSILCYSIGQGKDCQAFPEECWIEGEKEPLTGGKGRGEIASCAVASMQGQKGSGGRLDTAYSGPSLLRGTGPALNVYGVLRGLRESGSHDVAF